MEILVWQKSLEQCRSSEEQKETESFPSEHNKWSDKSVFLGKDKYKKVLKCSGAYNVNYVFVFFAVDRSGFNHCLNASEE